MCPKSQIWGCEGRRTPEAYQSTHLDQLVISAFSGRGRHQHQPCPSHAHTQIFMHTCAHTEFYLGRPWVWVTLTGILNPGPQISAVQLPASALVRQPELGQHHSGGHEVNVQATLFIYTLWITNFNLWKFNLLINSWQAGFIRPSHTRVLDQACYRHSDH